MADNAIANNGGSPVTFATDDIGAGVQSPRMKLMLGTDGVDDGNVSSSNALPTSDEGVTLLRRIFLLLKPLGVVTGAGSNRLSLDVNNIVAGTVTTVQTVNTVSNQNQMASITAFELLRSMNRAAYNSGIRSKIS